MSDVSSDGAVARLSFFGWRRKPRSTPLQESANITDTLGEKCTSECACDAEVTKTYVASRSDRQHTSDKQCFSSEQGASNEQRILDEQRIPGEPHGSAGQNSFIKQNSSVKQHNIVKQNSRTDSSEHSHDNSVNGAADSTAVTAAHSTGRFARVGAVARWTLAILACLWMALCTAVGPLYWDEGSIADWTWANTAYLVLSFAIYVLIVISLVRVGSGKKLLPDAIRRRLHKLRSKSQKTTATDVSGSVGTSNASNATMRHSDTTQPSAISASAVLATSATAPITGTADISNSANTSDTATDPTTTSAASNADISDDATGDATRHRTRVSTALHTAATAIRRAGTFLNRIIIKATDRWWKLLLIFIIGWLWIPTTLVTAFGADIRSQIREFSWAWNQWIGIEQPYIGFFSFVPMDIYPTAHYLWPEDPTYLTDQHNIVLTVFYGAIAALSRYLTGSNDLGYVVLSTSQYLFAAFCCAATADRFFNLNFLRRYTDKTTDATHANGTQSGSTHTGKRKGIIRAFLQRHHMTSTLPTTAVQDSVTPAGGLSRFLILVFFMFCPLAVFSTISLTKSPLFAFAFVWWFGLWYELHVTRGQTQPSGLPVRLARRSLVAFTVASCMMLISAKYAWYIIAAQIVLALLADHKRWRTYVVALLLPTIIIHGGVTLLISSGTIISGDPIESRGIQLQQIARVAKLNPDGIPESAREKLEPIFNLDQMADAYMQDDADPVKSSGIQAKKVSYKWRTVTAEDMEQFNSAWLEIVEANPVISLDAFLAKCYGYFDVTARPYTSMDYYVNSTYVQEQTTWIKDWCHDWRDSVAGFASSWSNIPVLGWLTHGNLYVSLTLLIGAAEVVLRRWRTVMWHIPLLLQMGVMITAPANNFERHMLSVAFVFGFLCLTFMRDRHSARANTDGSSAADSGSTADNSIADDVAPDGNAAASRKTSDSMDATAKDVAAKNATVNTDVVTSGEAMAKTGARQSHGRNSSITQVASSLRKRRRTPSVGTLCFQ